jgi:hypothetical protein
VNVDGRALMPRGTLLGVIRVIRVSDCVNFDP